jgi:DNA topoisomerase VI subunit A
MLVQVLAVMQLIVGAWRSNRWFTLRDIYYHLKGSKAEFASQLHSNRIVRDLQLAHAASLTSFRIKAAARGSFAGQVSFRLGERENWSSTVFPFSENQVINPGKCLHQSAYLCGCLCVCTSIYLGVEYMLVPRH